MLLFCCTHSPDTITRYLWKATWAAVEWPVETILIHTSKEIVLWKGCLIRPRSRIQAHRMPTYPSAERDTMNQTSQIRLCSKRHPRSCGMRHMVGAYLRV